MIPIAATSLFWPFTWKKPLYPPGLELRMGDIQAVLRYRMDDQMYERKIRKTLSRELCDSSQVQDSNASPALDVKVKRLGDYPKELTSLICSEISHVLATDDCLILGNVRVWLSQDRTLLLCRPTCDVTQYQMRLLRSCNWSVPEATYMKTVADVKKSLDSGSFADRWNLADTIAVSLQILGAGTRISVAARHT